MDIDKQLDAAAPMLKLEHRSVIGSAKLFVASVCILLIVLALWSDWSARQVLLNEARNTATNISRALAQHADDTFKESDTALIGISERLEYDGRSPAALLRLKRLLTMQVNELAQLHGVVIIDKEGNWIVNSDSLGNPVLNSKDRGYYIHHRAHNDSRPYIGRPVQSRVNGEWVVTISRRLNQADGSFDGVVMAAIKLSYFAQYYGNFEIGKTGALLLASNEGYIVIRRPLRNDSIGKSLINASIFRDHASKTSAGIARIRSAQDGITRISSFRHLDKYPFFVGAALAEDEVLANWKSDLILHAGVLLMLILFIGFFGNRLILQIQLRARAENEALQAKASVEILNQTLQGLAMRDGLTGLANRRCFEGSF